MSVVLVLDCGATNLRAIAIDATGQIIASHFIKNATQTGESHPDHHIWNFDTIWQSLVECAKNVVTQLAGREVLAVTVTTFGVDGAPFDVNGKQIYPIISWKCPRTLEAMIKVEHELNRIELYRENGIGDYSFNTIYKLRWLKEHEPEMFANMDKFVFISSMITHRLTGEWTTDRTMAGTSMMTSIKDGNWHPHVLKYLGLTNAHFPPMIDAGDVVGKVLPEIQSLFGLTSNVPVISAGHDTQFALVGSGAKENQAFLSSGTWEILMARSNQPLLDGEALKQGVTVELDSVRGLYNPAIQWLSSAVVEWVAKQFFAAEWGEPTLYHTMIREAEDAGENAGGVVFEPHFSPDANGQAQGALYGLTIHTTRGQIFRAALEGLSKKLSQRFDYLNSLCSLSDEPIVVVGGGTKNTLWNQLRADALGRPLHIIEQAEATVIGAAMFAFYGVKHFGSLYDAQQTMKPTLRLVEPISASSKHKKNEIKEPNHA